MAGVVKRKYQAETQRFIKELTRPLSQVSLALPCTYDKFIILDLFKELFPLHWDKLNKRYDLYKSKDEHLISVGKKRRYNHEDPENFFFNLMKVKHLLSKGVKDQHKLQFNDSNRNFYYRQLSDKKDLKVMSANERNNASLVLFQKIEPVYIDIFIAAYHRKGISTHEKTEIVNEIKKYVCDKSIEFFQKLNDSERNNQIRRMAFDHLQSIGEFVSLRKSFKGKTKKYAIEKDSFDVSPMDLIDRIEQGNIQSKKSYDMFISHSYLDMPLLLKVKDELNSKGISVYCDWLSDNDYLKRRFISEYTEAVLKKRIEQSKNILFLQTENSVNRYGDISSKWVSMELAYANEKSKQLFCLNFTQGESIFEDIDYESRGENIQLFIEPSGLLCT